MQPEQHFTFKKKWDKGIAVSGFILAHKCWMTAPSIDIRMAALYLFFGINQMWTYVDVEKKEEEYGLLH